MENNLTIENIKKVKQKRHYKITNSILLRTIFQHIRRNKFYGKTPVTDSQFYAIIRQVNDKIAEQLCKGYIIKFPKNMGHIEAFKYETTVKLQDGKVKTDRPVNWGETLKLWIEDKESYNNKILIRQNFKNMIKLYWNKNKCKCRNLMYFNFVFNRELKKKINYLFNDFYKI